MSNYSPRTPTPSSSRFPPLPSTPREDGGIRTLRCHSRYYLEDGLVFLVENTLFKLPRYMLVAESPIFADMLRTPCTSQSEGQLDTAPIQLQQTTAADFERLAELLYPKAYSNFSTTPAGWSETEWRSVLDLSTRWEMLGIRSQAIAQLSAHAGATRKILLGRQYDYPGWIRDGFYDLCTKSEPLSMQEAEEMTLKDVVCIGIARERIRMQAFVFGRRSRFTPPGLIEKFIQQNANEVYHILNETFGLEAPIPVAASSPPPSSPPPSSPPPSF